MKHNVPKITPTSKQLIAFIESHTKKNPFRLSKISQKCLSSLCDDIHYSWNHPVQYTCTDIQSTMSNVINEFMKTRNATYIPKPILDKILLSEKMGRLVEMKMHNRPIQLYFIVPKSTNPTHSTSRIFSKDKSIADSFFNTCIQRTMVWLNVALKYAGKECATDLKCYFLLTDDNKMLPLSGGGDSTDKETSLDNILPITEKHANTAFTFACAPSNTIVIYRIEEWFKVFIHESFHCFGLDFSNMSITESNRQLSKLFPKCRDGLDFRFYETYCETWAETLNVLCIAYFTEMGKWYRSKLTQKRSKHISSAYSREVFAFKKTAKYIRTSKNAETQKRKRESIHRLLRVKILKTTEKMLQYERIYSLYQMGKVLSYHKLRYSDLCNRPDSDNVGGLSVTPVTKDKYKDMESSMKYEEEVCVFSYYIVKSVFMFYLNDFIEWCYHANGSRQILYFRKTNKNILDYGLLLERHYLLPEFMEAVVEPRNKYSRYITHPEYFTKNALIYNTLRMSLHEMVTE